MPLVALDDEKVKLNWVRIDLLRSLNYMDIHMYLGGEHV